MQATGSKVKLPQLLLLLLLLLLAGSCEGGEVQVQFYMNQLSKWESLDQQSSFQQLIVDGLQQYCDLPDKQGQCGINATLNATFTTSSVKISNGYPINEGSRYLLVKFSISYSLGTGSSEFTLPAEHTIAIVENQRAALSSEISHVLYIDTKFFSLPPATLANQVIIPIFVLGTLILVIVALALRSRHWQRNELPELKRAQQAAANSRKSRNHAPANGERRPKDRNRVGDSSVGQVGQDGDETGNGRPSWSGKNSSNKATGSANNPNGQFNIGYDKSLNEAELRRSGVNGGAASAAAAATADSNATSTSQVIQVQHTDERGGADKKVTELSAEEAKRLKKEKKKKKKQLLLAGSCEGGEVQVQFYMNQLSKWESLDQQSSFQQQQKEVEEVMLVQNALFTQPDNNVAESGSDNDTRALHDSSSQMMM